MVSPINPDAPAFRFDWDESKRLRNLLKHRLDFKDAIKVFRAITVTELDDRFDYGEDRYLTLGLLNGRCVVIAHTESGNRLRIISMRYALKHEEIAYFNRPRR